MEPAGGRCITASTLPRPAHDHAAYSHQIQESPLTGTAAIVVEIVSPDDETYAKLPFYVAHGVDEAVVIEPDERRVGILVLEGDQYSQAHRSAHLAVDAAQLERAISWP